MTPGRIARSTAALLAACALTFCVFRAKAQSVVAGTPPTAKIMVNPVPAKVGPPYPPLIGGAPNIVGNELRLDAGGVRVWVEVQFEDWDPNGDGSPGARNFVVELDGSGLLDADINGDGSVTDDGDQEDIALARVPYHSCSECIAAFGEAAPEVCSPTNVCDAVYTDKDGVFRADGWCAGEGCSCGSNAFITESGWRVFGCYVGTFRPDDGTVRWGATAVYDVPPGAKGKYTVELDTQHTGLSDGSVPAPHAIPSLSETGFVINILTGRCCFGSGTRSEGCIDAVTRAECGNEAAPVVFTPEARCPPDGPDCERVVGSCCNGDPFAPCTVETILSECQCATCTWHERQTCQEVECPASPIPTASSWGLAALGLLLMIGAKIVFRRPMARRT